MLYYGQMERSKGQSQCLENEDSVVGSCGFKKLLSSGKQSVKGELPANTIGKLL